MSFIDLHTHILPSIDDGSRSFEESEQILEGMFDIGYQWIAMTPHLRQGMFSNFNENIRKKFSEFKEKLSQSEKSKRYNIVIGGEYHFDYYFLKCLENNDIITINSSEYFLLELNNFQEPPNLKEVIYKAQLKGYTPIITHPERYVYFQEKPQKIIELKNHGALFQGSMSSFLAPKDKLVQKTSALFLKKELFDFIATDIHNLTFLKKYLLMVLNQIKKKCSSDYYSYITYKNAKETVLRTCYDN